MLIMRFMLMGAACLGLFACSSNDDAGPRADLDAPLGPASEFLIQDVPRGLPADTETRRYTNTPTIADGAVDDR